MFKNLQIYRLPRPWGVGVTLQHLQELLAPQQFAQCSSSEKQSMGWVSPRNNDLLVHSVSGQLLLSLGVETKLLPAPVVNAAAKARAAEIEQQQGFKPGRKQFKEIKEQVYDELLPRAFSSFRKTDVWIDPVDGWLVIDSSSPGRADEVLKYLLKCIDKFPVETLHVNRSPVSCMTDWLASDEAPYGFTVDQDTELRATGEARATVRYQRHHLEAADVQRHIGAGKQASYLAMTWQSKVSFVLTQSLTLKKITPLDVLKQNYEGKDTDERFDGDFMLMTGELRELFNDLIAALGGESEVEPNPFE